MRWFRSHPDKRLRLSSGLNVAANRSIELAILKLDSGAANRVTVVPRSYSDYAPGANPRWDHATALQPQFRGDPWVWHQYAIFGSFPGSPTPPHVTFLEQFLNDSGF